MSEDRIRRLARAEGDAETLATLVAGQRTKRLLLLRLLFDALDTPAPGPACDGAAEHADLLVRADLAAPEAAREAVYYPLVGPWLQESVLRLEHGGAPAPGRLGGLAVAAATRAGLAFSTRVDPGGGRLVLPTLGALRVPSGATVAVSGEAGTLTLRPQGERPAAVRRDGDGETWRSADPRWLPLRPLPGGPRTVYLDAVDDGAVEDGAAVAPRSGRHRRWERLWRGALPLLRAAGGDRYAALSLLACIVPLAPGGPGAHKAGTSPQGFGAVLTREPPGPVGLAETLTHELQHAKLGALAELTPLHAADTTPRYWAPWRPDPRPFDGLLHGVYAHLELAGFWQRLALAATDSAERNAAWARFARNWAMVDAALPQVWAADALLTHPGRTFITALSAHHAALRTDATPAHHLTRATATVAAAKARWQRDHPT